MNQNQLILKHLQTGATLTPLESLELHGCFRLSARISELKSEGHNIKKEMVERNGKKFAKYSLQKEGV